MIEKTHFRLGFRCNPRAHGEQTPVIAACFSCFARKIRWVATRGRAEVFQPTEPDDPLKAKPWFVKEAGALLTGVCLTHQTSFKPFLASSPPIWHSYSRATLITASGVRTSSSGRDQRRVAPQLLEFATAHATSETVFKNVPSIATVYLT